MYPTIEHHISLTIAPEKYVDACDLSQLYELQLLTGIRIRQLQNIQNAKEPDKDNSLDIANQKHQIYLKQCKKEN